MGVICETHPSAITLIPSIIVSHHGCDCCNGGTWMVMLEFGPWSIGIYFPSHP